MNTTHLRRAIEIMREVEAKQLPFDMCNWLSHFGEGTTPPFGIREHTCGTAACMFGWCGLDEGFQKEGLAVFLSFYKGDPYYENYDEKKLINPTIAEQNRLIHEEGWQLGTAGVSFEGEGGTAAAARFFGISIGAAEYLTLPGRYDEGKIFPEDVIKRLENVLNGIFEEPEESESDEYVYNDEPYEDDPF